jgi:2-polyprenyl-3-methyl-5-hydroxy-6-metoxy-1,4-benzoquinol methylase
MARRDLEILSRFTGVPADECLSRLSSYSLEEMARAWRRRDPRTPAEMRAFYGETDLYIWELFGWHGSPDYEPYLQRVDRIAELWPPASHPRALDYGTGIGTAALRLARLGYDVTIADVRGRTLDFARARLHAHGVPAGAIEIDSDVLEFPSEHWDVIVSFDVFEHVPKPAAVVRALVRALRTGGGAAMVAGFDAHGERWPHHLAGGTTAFAGHRWPLLLQGLGMKHLGDSIYVKLGQRERLVRKLQYRLWRLTGLHIKRLER